MKRDTNINWGLGNSFLGMQNSKHMEYITKVILVDKNIVLLLIA